jgi:hypothetical protein
VSTGISGQRHVPGIQGLLWLDLAQTTTVGVLVMPATTGIATVSVALPALAGVRLYAQALIASPTSGIGMTPLLVEDPLR